MLKIVQLGIKLWSRKFSTSVTGLISNFTVKELIDESKNGIQVKEILIPVPWGHIAGKTWGENNNNPLLAVHGWLDNCGSFDTIAPLLCEKNFLIAIDLPGHGFSSHFPVGFSYNSFDMMLSLKRIVDSIGLTKFSYIGHSYGGGLGLMFAGAFSHHITKLISLDFLKGLTTPLDMFSDCVTACYEHMRKSEKMNRKRSYKIYNYTEALDRIINIYGSSLTDEQCKMLLKRGIRSFENTEGYCFTRDPRLLQVLGQNYFCDQQLLSLAKNLTCDLLIIKSREGLYFEPDDVVETFLKTYKERANTFQYVEIDGNHHAHLNSPESVGGIVSEFLVT